MPIPAGSVQIHFRVSQPLQATVEQLATAEGITPSAWWRRAGDEQVLREHKRRMARLSLEAKMRRLEAGAALAVQRAANLAKVKAPQGA